MKEGMFIVNTSRGAGMWNLREIEGEANLPLSSFAPVIDEHALVRAMESGKVSRVGLDVFEKEPAVHPYLMKSDRASLLPVSCLNLRHNEPYLCIDTILSIGEPQQQGPWSTLRRKVSPTLPPSSTPVFRTPRSTILSTK